MNLKKGYYEASIHQVFRFDYTKVNNLDERLHEYVQLGHKYLVGKFYEDSEVEFFHICNPTEKQITEFEINNPYQIQILNILRDDNDLKKMEYKITPYKNPPNPYDALRIAVDTTNVQRIKNYYNYSGWMDQNVK